MLRSRLRCACPHGHLRWHSACACVVIAHMYTCAGCQLVPTLPLHTSSTCANIVLVPCWYCAPHLFPYCSRVWFLLAPIVCFCPYRDDVCFSLCARIVLAPVLRLHLRCAFTRIMLLPVLRMRHRHVCAHIVLVPTLRSRLRCACPPTCLLHTCVYDVLSSTSRVRP